MATCPAGHGWCPIELTPGHGFTLTLDSHEGVTDKEPSDHHQFRPDWASRAFVAVRSAARSDASHCPADGGLKAAPYGCESATNLK